MPTHCGNGPLEITSCLSSINQLNLVWKRFCSEWGSAAKEPLQRKGHRSERQKKMWKTRSLKGHERACAGKVCGKQPKAWMYVVQSRTFKVWSSFAMWAECNWIDQTQLDMASWVRTHAWAYIDRLSTECTLGEWTSPFTEVGCWGILREWISQVNEGGTLWIDRSLHRGTSSVTRLEHTSCNT
jgi:hypothetical protein